MSVAVRGGKYGRETLVLIECDDCGHRYERWAYLGEVDDGECPECDGRGTIIDDVGVD